jgi:hypothetical protein
MIENETQNKHNVFRSVSLLRISNPLESKMKLNAKSLNLIAPNKMGFPNMRIEII